MTNYMFYKAAQFVKLAYKAAKFQKYSTEWTTGFFNHGGVQWQYIAIAGSNDIIDWLWNITMISWDRVKLSCYVAAKRILRKTPVRADMPLLVCGHSKSGGTAVYLAKLLKADYCIAFNPAPAFRGKQLFDKTTIVIDPDDIIHHLGRINFNQPLCKTYKMPNDKKGIDLSDHNIDNSIKHFSSIA